MAWWVIVLLLLAAFGPVLWIMPSQRDRLLARLRAGARNRGLLVELSQLPDLGAPPEARVSAGGKRREPMLACTAYRLPLPRSVNHAPCWRAIAYANDESPLVGWTVEGRVPDADGAYWAEVAALVEPVSGAVPGAIDAVETGRNQVSVYWRERVPLDALDSTLDRLQSFLQALAEWHWEVEQKALQKLAGDDPEFD
jgi:hypothetical protein